MPPTTARSQEETRQKEKNEDGRPYNRPNTLNIQVPRPRELSDVALSKTYTRGYDIFKRHDTNPTGNKTSHLGWIMHVEREKGVGLGGDPTDTVVKYWRQGQFDVPIPAGFKEPSETWCLDPERKIEMRSSQGNTFDVESRPALLAKLKHTRLDTNDVDPLIAEQVSALSQPTPPARRGPGHTKAERARDRAKARAGVRQVQAGVPAANVDLNARARRLLKRAEERRAWEQEE